MLLFSFSNSNGIYSIDRTHCSCGKCCYNLNIRSQSDLIMNTRNMFLFMKNIMPLQVEIHYICHLDPFTELKHAFYQVG